MQIPIASGIYTDSASEIRTIYPRNMIPVFKSSGVSEGFMRPAEGMTGFGTTGPGQDRGSINWNGVCYRVMGSRFVSIAADGAVTDIGYVGGTTTPVSMDYSFDHLAIASNGNLFLYDGVTLAQNTDPDLGTVLDVIYVDGYFMTTDGSYLVVTDLGNPFSVNPLKYGSSEVDPDPVVGLLKIRNEVYAVNRHTIEIFQNIGGELFPFQRVEGTRIDRGAFSACSKCQFIGTVAFIGSGRNEAPGIWIGLNADSEKISTREIDLILQEYTENQLELTVLHSMTHKGQRQLWVRLPDKTLVYDNEASKKVGAPVWSILCSSLVGDYRYTAEFPCWCYDKWIVADSCCIGYLDDTVSTHWGQKIGWEVSTPMIYNESRGAIVNEIELVAITGRAPLGISPTIWTSYSTDGMTWSQEKAISAGELGQRNKRLCWRRQGFFRNYRIQKFRGDSDSLLTLIRMEAKLEALS